jgi:uncharacterized membrane protein YGL010W
MAQHRFRGFMMNFRPAPGSRLDAQFNEYDSYHRHPMNERLHYIGVPMIMLAILGFFSFLPVADRIDGGFVLWGTAAAYYIARGRQLGIMFSGLAFLIYLGARELALSTLVASFVVGWIIQGVGHARYERNKPAFLKNFEHLLIGPLWLFSRLLGGRKPSSSHGGR